MSMKAALEILGFGPCYHSEIRRECTLNFKGSVLQHGERDIVAICSRDIGTWQEGDVPLRSISFVVVFLREELEILVLLANGMCTVEKRLGKQLGNRGG